MTKYFDHCCLNRNTVLLFIFGIALLYIGAMEVRSKHDYGFEVFAVGLVFSLFTALSWLVSLSYGGMKLLSNKSFSGLYCMCIGIIFFFGILFFPKAIAGMNIVMGIAGTVLPSIGIYILFFNQKSKRT